MNPKKYAIGVDVGGSHLCSAVVDLDRKALCSEPVLTPMDSSGPAEAILSCFKANLQGTMDAFGERVDQIGLAFPGPFDYEKGIPWMEQKFQHLYGLNMPDELHRQLEDAGISFKFINDASAFALGECFCGSGRDRRRVLALTLGTGVGSGFVEDGVLVEHSDRVPEGGEVWNLPFEGTVVDASFSTRWVVGRYLALTGKTVPGAKEVAQACATEPEARQLFREYGGRLAAFAAPVLEKFGADTLVLGGNISRNYPLFCEPLLAGMPEGVEVRTSTLLDQAAMIGAASLFKVG
ncbi:MAG: ROK family protein [Bacteroidales bacterium]|nr:ROK family protein [Bacteroidales bacterium]